VSASSLPRFFSSVYLSSTAESLDAGLSVLVKHSFEFSFFLFVNKGNSLLIFLSRFQVINKLICKLSVRCVLALVIIILIILLFFNFLLNIPLSFSLAGFWLVFTSFSPFLILTSVQIIISIVFIILFTFRF